jgi:endoglucanase Acf2
MDITGSEWYLEGESDKGIYFANVLQYPRKDSTDPVNRSVNYLTLSKPYDISKPTSVSGWVQIVKVPYPGQSATILDFGTGENTDYLQLTAYNDNPSTSYKTDCMLFATAGNAGSYSNGIRINQDTWVHFAVVFVPSTSLTLYVNGMKISNITTGVGAGGIGATFKIADNATTSYIGKGFRPFAGLIDEFRIHDTALSQADVTKLYMENFKASTVAAPTSRASPASGPVRTSPAK